MSSLDQAILNQLEMLTALAKREEKKTGFVIGNTAKSVSQKPYTVPIRNTPLIVTGGVIVYSEQEAVKLASMVDGKVDYLFVDSEKKIANNNSRNG